MQCDALYKLRGETVNILTYTNASSFRQVILDPSNSTVYDQTRISNMSFQVPMDADYGTYTVKSIAGGYEATTWLTVLDVSGWTLASFPHVVEHKALNYTFFRNWTIKVALEEDELFIDMSKLRDWSVQYGLDVTALQNSMNFLVRFNKAPYFSMDLTFSFIHSGMKLIINGTQDQPRDFTFKFNAKAFKRWFDGVKSDHIIFDWSDIPKNAFTYNSALKQLTVHIPESFHVDPVIFEDGFESNDFSAWTGTGNSAGETCTVETADPHCGTYNAKFQTDSSGFNEYAYCYKNIDGQTTLYARTYFNETTSFPAAWHVHHDIIGFRNQTNGDIAYCGVIFEGSIYWYLGYLDGGTFKSASNGVWNTSSSPSVGTQYLIELYAFIDGSSGEYKVYIDGVETLSVSSIDTDDRGIIDQVRMGLAWSTSNVVHAHRIDCCVISDSYIGPESEGPSHTDAELSETVNLSASLETQKDMHNLFSETVTVSSSCGVVKSLTRVTGETAGVSADYLSVKTLTRTAGESSVVTSVFESSKGITQVLAELSETVTFSASLLVQKAIYVLASGTVDLTAVLETAKHLGATFIELLETLPFTAYLEVVLPEIPLTVEVVVVIAFLALAIAVSAFAYVATRERD